MRALEISKPTAFGHLDLLWLTVQDQRGPDEDGVLRGWTDQDIADAAEWDGEPTVFVKAAHESGFLDYDDGTYAVHDYVPWMPLHVKERVRKRQAYQLTESRHNFPEVSRKSPGRLAEVPPTVGGTSPPHVHVHEHVHVQKDPPTPQGDSDGGSGGKRKADLLALDGLPQEFACDAFKAAWADWVGHRRDIRHPLTPRAKRMQFSNMAKWGVERSIAAIRMSIPAGYQKLVEPWENKRGSPGSESRLGRVEAPAGKYAGVRIITGPPATPDT